LKLVPKHLQLCAQKPGGGKGSSAYVAGVSSGDRIVSINGSPVVSLNKDEIIEILGGLEEVDIEFFSLEGKRKKVQLKKMTITDFK